MPADFSGAHVQCGYVLRSQNETGSPAFRMASRTRSSACSWSRGKPNLDLAVVCRHANYLDIGAGFMGPQG